MSDIKVLIADDHPIVSQGIHQLLSSAVGITVVGAAATGQQALHMTAELKPDVVILDIEMPESNGIEVVTKLVEEKYKVKVLVLSAYDDRQYIVQLLSLGASGYLLKDEAAGTIVEAVRGVARGEKGWVSHKVAAQLSKMLDQSSESGDQGLTARELEVLQQLAQGKTNAEIGLELGISEKTVEKHLDFIYRKLGVSSRVEAAVLAVQKHIF